MRRLVKVVIRGVYLAWAKNNIRCSLTPLPHPHPLKEIIGISKRGGCLTRIQIYISAPFSDQDEPFL